MSDELTTTHPTATTPEQANGASWTSYDSRVSLKCCASPGLDAKIGVRAGRPFHHHGLGAQYVDISRETVRINTATFGACYPAGSLTDEVDQATRRTIDDLDTVISELTAHRDRLYLELTNPPDAEAERTRPADQ